MTVTEQRGQPHKQSVLSDNGWRNLLNNLLTLFNKQSAGMGCVEG